VYLASSVCHAVLRHAIELTLPERSAVRAAIPSPPLRSSSKLVDSDFLGLYSSSLTSSLSGNHCTLQQPISPSK